MWRRLASITVLIVIFGFASQAGAQPSAQFEEFQLDLRIDIPLIALGAAVSVGGLLKRSDLPACVPNCDASTINVLDRPVFHYHSSSASTVASAMLPVMLAAPLVLTAIDTHFKGFFADAVVLTEALMLTQLVTQLTKFAVERNSPVLYGGDPNRPGVHDIDATRSFISSHTSTTFCAASVYTTSYFLRHPDDPARFAVLATSAVLSIVTGVLMVLSGVHFWTDVLAGAAVGSAVGVLVPILHVALR